VPAKRASKGASGISLRLTGVLRASGLPPGGARGSHLSMRV
jgi:hypothetical protein